MALSETLLMILGFIPCVVIIGIGVYVGHKTVENLYKDLNID